MVYVINPLIWLGIAYIVHVLVPIKSKRALPAYKDIVFIVIAISLIYDICYYSLGLLVGYTHNPYSTNIDGIIINLFSIFFSLCLKEYVRYRLLYVQPRHYKIIYYSLLFIIFVYCDINIANIGSYDNIIGLISKEFMIPIISNAFLFFLVIVADYKVVILNRAIMVLPTLLFNALPNYSWPIIVLYSFLFYLITYILVQHTIDKSEQRSYGKVINSSALLRLIGACTAILLLIAFGLGFFPIKPFVVLSGSMKPSINPGDMVIITNYNTDDIEIGDIIAYRLGEHTIIHRVVAIHNTFAQKEFILKGDSNTESDTYPVESTQIIGKFKYCIPYLGYPAYLFRNMGNNDKTDIVAG